MTAVGGGGRLYTAAGEGVRSGAADAGRNDSDSGGSGCGGSHSATDDDNDDDVDDDDDGDGGSGGRRGGSTAGRPLPWLGVRLVWTHPRARRRGVAAALLAAARGWGVLGATVPARRVAYTSPTAAGAALAAAVAGREGQGLWVYAPRGGGARAGGARAGGARAGGASAGGAGAGGGLSSLPIPPPSTDEL